MVNTITTAPAEWLVARKHYIGGSDIAAVMGIHPYKTAIDVWADKLNQAPPFEGTLRTRLGEQLEQFVADEFASATGTTVEVVEKWFADPEIRYFGGRIDRKIVPDGVLEIKVVGPRQTHRWSDGPPDEVVCQLQWYLMLTRARLGYVAAMHLESGELQIRELAASDELIAEMRAAGERFWQRHVLTGVPPEPDGSDRAAELIRKLVPRADDLIIEATPELVDTVRELERVATDARALYKRKAQLEQTIQLAMGAASIMMVPGYDKPITWKNVKDTVGLDYKAIYESLRARGIVDDALAKQIETECTTTLRRGGRQFLTPWSRAKQE